MIVAWVLAVLLLGGLGVTGALYLSAHRDGGTAPTGATLPARCDLVSQQTRQRLRTTNPNDALSTENHTSSELSTSCAWKQTKGVDGDGERGLLVVIDSFTAAPDHDQSPEDQAAQDFASYRKSAQASTPGDQVQFAPVAGLGDEAYQSVTLTNSSFTKVSVAVRKGAQVVEVNYDGWDVGMFSTTQPPVDELTAAARSVLTEVLGRL